MGAVLENMLTLHWNLFFENVDVYRLEPLVVKNPFQLSRNVFFKN